jgi:hypothetical protein
LTGAAQEHRRTHQHGIAEKAQKDEDQQAQAQEAHEAEPPQEAASL